MKRNAFNNLIEWKNNPNRKPLVLQGARQVGKTWLMNTFGKEYYKKVAYVSFNDREDVKKIFEESYNVQNIIMSLSLLCDVQITPNDTLIIFDEIQECERALNSLKFFNENAKEYHIITAGSLLGVALKQKEMSFPVGQVEFLTIYPFTFCEFLEALDEIELCKLIYSKNTSVIKVLKDKYINLLKQYMFIGGMPEVIKTFIKTKNFKNVRKIQNQILEGYQKDFAKYTQNHNIAKINAIWNSIPSQFAKENKKFTFSTIQKSARAREYEDALEWLILCGLVYKVHNVSKPELPLIAYEEQSNFKIYMLDIGLLGAKTSIDAKIIIDGNNLFNQFKGSFAEQYVLQVLKSLENIPIGYWTSNSTAEIDFIMQYDSMIIPVEVKSSINLKAKSLGVYREKYKPIKSIRTSLADFEINNGLYNIPLYLIENVERYLD